MHKEIAPGRSACQSHRVQTKLTLKFNSSSVIAGARQSFLAIQRPLSSRHATSIGPDGQWYENDKQAHAPDEGDCYG